MKKTLILGASTNPERYAFIAAHRLSSHGHPIELVGLKEGIVAGKQIHTDKPIIENIDTVTLYVGSRNQPEWYDYVLSLHPKRVIFNPGTENDEFAGLLAQNGIEAQEACTLVLLSMNAY
jgi:predicted CoA-binding protein